MNAWWMAVNIVQVAALEMVRGLLIKDWLSVYDSSAPVMSGVFMAALALEVLRTSPPSPAASS